MYQAFQAQTTIYLKGANQRLAERMICIIYPFPIISFRLLLFIYSEPIKE